MASTRMRQVCCFVIGLVAIRAATAQPSTFLALTNATVCASPTAAPLNDGVVIVRGTTITEVGARSAVAIPAGATTIDCRGSVVLAGYQNSHVHFTEEKWVAAAQQPAQKLSDQLQAMLTRFGFTTVVDTGSLLANTIAIRRRIDSGEINGPRILTAGIPLYPPDGIPYYLRDSGLPPDQLKLLHQPSTEMQAVDAVRQDIDGGADLIKLFTGSWVTNQRVQPMPINVATAAAVEAHRRRRLVFSHASNLAGLEVALGAGVDVIAHALDDTRGLAAEHLRRMKNQQMALIPTLTLFADSDHARQIFAEVVDYQRLGGQILFGTDVGYHTMYDPTLEYESLKKAGLTWREVLASLTTNPAERFGESTRRGRLAPGMDADLVVLGGDPASDLREFADVRQTIRSGRIIYSRSDISRSSGS
jgi:imidazolonepropionase-like amidohydrolase